MPDLIDHESAKGEMSVKSKLVEQSKDQLEVPKAELLSRNYAITLAM